MLRKQRNKWRTRASYKPFTTRPIASQPQLLPCFFFTIHLTWQHVIGYSIVHSWWWTNFCHFTSRSLQLKRMTGKATKKKRPEGPELPQAESHIQRLRLKKEAKLSGGDGWGPWLCLSSTTTFGKVCTTSTKSDPFMIKYWDGRTIIKKRPPNMPSWRCTKPFHPPPSLFLIVCI